MAMTTRLGSVLLALMVAVAAMLLALVGPLAKPAKTQDAAPSTLDGENLDAETVRNYLDFIDGPGEVTVEAVNCSIEKAQGTGSISYTATGDATGPYPGTFTETGTFALGDSPPDAFLPGQRTITSFQAEFEIDSPTTGFRITGTKSAENLTLLARCYELEGGIFPGTTQVRIVVPGGGDDPDAVNYEAKIETASATFADRGTSFVLLREISFSDGESSGELVEFSENFSSSLSQPELIGLTKEQCNDGGYKRFGFKNQGDCVSFVETEGKNHPN